MPSSYQNSNSAVVGAFSGTQPDQAAAQGGLESVAGDEPHRIGGHHLLPALQRQHRRGEGAQDGGAHRPRQEGQQRRHGEQRGRQGGGERHAEPRPVARHREGEGADGQSGDLGSVRLDREGEGDQQGEARGPRGRGAGTGATRVPARAAGSGGRGRDRARRHPRCRTGAMWAPNSAEHDRHDGARHHPERQQVEVRRAHPVGQGEIAEKGEPDRGRPGWPAARAPGRGTGVQVSDRADHSTTSMPARKAGAVSSRWVAGRTGRWRRSMTLAMISRMTAIGREDHGWRGGPPARGPAAPRTGRRNRYAAAARRRRAPDR